jgi:hypothetical protein
VSDANRGADQAREKNHHRPVYARFGDRVARIRVRTLGLIGGLAVLVIGRSALGFVASPVRVPVAGVVGRQRLFGIRCAASAAVAREPPRQAQLLRRPSRTSSALAINALMVPAGVVTHAGPSIGRQPDRGGSAEVIEDPKSGRKRDGR